MSDATRSQLKLPAEVRHGLRLPLTTLLLIPLLPSAPMWIGAALRPTWRSPDSRAVFCRMTLRAVSSEWRAREGLVEQQEFFGPWGPIRSAATRLALVKLTLP